MTITDEMLAAAVEAFATRLNATLRGAEYTRDKISDAMVAAITAAIAVRAGRCDDCGVALEPDWPTFCADCAPTHGHGAPSH